MKGQYLAVETVLTFGLGLIVAIGVITVFHQYRMGAMDAAEPYQVELISSKISSAMNSLKEIDEDGKMGSGSIEVDLPDNLAGESYSIGLGQNLTVSTGTEQYEIDLVGFDKYVLEGGVSGGDVTVFKQQNKFLLRAE